MILTPQQIKDITDTLDKRVSVFIATNIGPEFLDSNQKRVLSKAGINYNELYSLSKDKLFLSFQLGLLSSVIGESKSKNLSYTQLKSLIDNGEYIKLNARERATLQSIKTQSLSDIKSLQGKIFSDVNNIVYDTTISSRINQEKFIRDEIVEGARKRKSTRAIVSSIANKTGDWSRDFTRIVEYVSHRALSEGRVAIVERKSGLKGLVYMDVYEGACKYCINAYLTGGIGSRPKIFTIGELLANGTNIGRKASEYKPVIPPAHPKCRCNVHEYDEGSTWNEEKRAFEIKDYKSKIERPKVTVTVGEKKYKV